MLYELIAIVRQGNLSEVREIAKTAGQQVLRGNGVVRGLTNWGPFDLPRPTTKHQTNHARGHYFVMRFDSSADTQHEIRRTLGLDPRMVRFSIVKMGHRLSGGWGGKLGAMEDIPGKVEWNNTQEKFTKDILRASGIDAWERRTKVNSKTR